MTALANRQPAAVAIHAIAPPDPPMPPAIAHAVAGMLAPVVGRGQFGKDDPGHYVAPAALTEHQWQDAQRIADRFDAMLIPVTRDVIAAWLMPVNVASRNPQAPAEFAMRVAGIAEMVGDLPAAAFTAESRRRLTTGFFPSHEDVRKAVEPEAEAWVRKRNALRSLRQASAPAPAKPDERTPEEIAAVQAKAAAFYADMAAADAAKQTIRTAAPRPLSPAALIASYEAIGTGPALHRAATLRRLHDMQGDEHAP